MAFGKRKPQAQEPTQSTGSTSSTEPQGPTAHSTFSTVIVPRSAVESSKSPDKAYKLVSALIDFVNTMFDVGQFNRNEIPVKAVQAYHTDYYQQQVNNGGHSQFVHNALENLPFLILDVKAALAAISAAHHASIFDRFADWVTAHPQAAKQQTGFAGGIAPELKTLDTEFFINDLSRRLADWILSLPELRIVNDADYQEAMRRAAMMNPMREARQAVKSVARLMFLTSDWLRVGVGLACGATELGEAAVGLGSGGYMDIEGQEQMAIHVKTDKAERFCVVTEEGAACFERHSSNAFRAPDMNDPDDMQRSFDEFVAKGGGRDYAGKRLSTVKLETIAQAIEIANECRAGPAVDLLLRRAGLTTGVASLTAFQLFQTDLGQREMLLRWTLVLQNGVAYMVVTSSQRAVLMNLRAEPLSKANNSEAIEHMDRLAVLTQQPTASR
jgi:hypothetical protein